MTTFITSDTHFGHVRIVKDLGREDFFSSLEEHDETIVSNWNSVVAPDDTVLHLGDVAMGIRAESLANLGRCNGRKILIPGNHDNIASVMPESKRNNFRALYEQYFAEIWDEKVVWDNVVLSHYPPAEIEDHGGEDRYPHMRPALEDGTLYLHGHSHQTDRVRVLSNGSIAVSVGMDANNFTPVRLSSIYAEYLPSKD